MNTHDRASYEIYLNRIEQLPFVKSARMQHAKQIVQEQPVVLIETPSGTDALRLDLKKSHLNREVAARAIERHPNESKPLLVLAPSIGEGLGQKLADAGVNFMDQRGNCFLNLRDRYVARFQRRMEEPRTSRSKGLRTPAYRVLYALIVDSSLIAKPIRTIAAGAGVSRQAAMDMRNRLVDRGLVFRKGKTYSWNSYRTNEVLDTWLAGYGSAVRPSLLIGSYRTKDRAPGTLEKKVRLKLSGMKDWRWGGGTAAYRLTRHYRGLTTVVHFGTERSNLPRLLGAIPDPRGSLILLRFPGPLGLRGVTPDTAEPLLVYSELLYEGSERGRETAAEILRRFIPLGQPQ